MYLVPTTIAFDRWSERQPSPFLSWKLDESTISDQSSGIRVGPPSMLSIGFESSTLTPGFYRVKVIATGPSPPGSSGGGGRAPGERVWENAESPLVRIMAGRVTDGIHMLCRDGGGE